MKYNRLTYSGRSTTEPHPQFIEMEANVQYIFRLKECSGLRYLSQAYWRHGAKIGPFPCQDISRRVRVQLTKN